MPKEKNMWLGLVGIGIAFVGMLFVVIPSGLVPLIILGYTLLATGVVMSFVGMIINRKNKHVVALVATLVTVLMCNVALLVQFSVEGVRMGIVESQTEEADAEDDEYDVKVVGMNKPVTADDITFEAVRFKQQKDNYRTIDITLSNTSKNTLEYSVDNLMIVEDDDDEWLFVDALNRKSSMAAVSDKNVKFLEDGILSPGETIKKRLVYESTNDQDYLMIPMNDTEVAAIKLKP